MRHNFGQPHDQDGRAPREIPQQHDHRQLCNKFGCQPAESVPILNHAILPNDAKPLKPKPQHSCLHGQDHQHANGGWRSLAEALHLPGFSHDHDHSTAKVVALTGSASKLGIRTIWWSLLLLGLTTVIQVVIYWLSGSVALLGDTVHNFGDALNTLPLLVAFMLTRRVATSRYRYGFGRAEDLAGLAIVASMAISAIYIGIESWQKLLNPTQITQLSRLTKFIQFNRYEHVGWVINYWLI